MSTTARATKPANPDSPVLPLTTLLAGLPDNLRPNYGETQRIAQQRNDWLTQNIVGQTATVVIIAQNLPTKMGGGVFVGGELHNPPDWAVTNPNTKTMAIFCDFDTADATVAPAEGAGPGTDGKLFRGDTVTIRGEIEGPNLFGAQVLGSIRNGISLGHCRVLSVQAFGTPSVADQNHEPHPLEELLNSLPKNLWPAAGENEAALVARQQWIKNIEPKVGKYTYQCKIISVSVSNIDLSKPNRVVARVSLGTMNVWGRAISVEADVRFENVRVTDVASWKPGQDITINALSTGLGYELRNARMLTPAILTIDGNLIGTPTSKPAPGATR
jgi:hypothetical protein